jgi:hypothetical protein
LTKSLPEIIAGGVNSSLPSTTSPRANTP